MLFEIRSYLADISSAAFAASQALYYDKTPEVNIFLQTGFALAGRWPEISQTLAEYEPDDDHFPEIIALDLGRQFSTLVHCLLHLAFQRGLKNSGIYQPDQNLHSHIAYQERQYYLRLSETRAASLESSILSLDHVFENCIYSVQTDLYVLLEHIAGLSKSERGEHSISVRACHLARQYAMLLSALAYLRHRLMTGRSISGLSRVAENRENIRRLIPSMEVGVRDISSIPEYSRTTVIAFVDDHQWIDRPNIPYSKANVADYDYEIRVHRKDMNGHGIGNASWVWVKGKVEYENDQAYLVAEFEGPGQHSDDYWEDWLASEVRKAYDLYPGVIHMEWEFPDLDELGSMSDLIARTNDLLFEEDNNG